MTPDIKYWLAINSLPKIGPAKIKKLYNYFPSMREAWESSSNQWIEAGIEKETALNFSSKKYDINPDQLFEELQKENIQVIHILDPNYPPLLKEIYNPPAILYYKGNLPHPSDFCLAVVGPRKISQYGKQVTIDIVNDLARNQITIISGLALGVDSLAHQTTLDNSGKTIAVLGGGINKASIYPPVNKYLADKIIESGGAVISEYAPNTIPTKFNFPARNRIVSGLSLGTLLTEAPQNSGSLITAQCALEQNREVFAVPGNIYSPNSQGTNKLIQQGARTVFCANDILEVLNLEQIQNVISTQKISPDTKEEEILLQFLSKEPTHIDILTKKSNLPANIVSSTLTMMEMKSKVKNLGAMNYVLTR